MSTERINVRILRLGLSAAGVLFVVVVALSGRSVVSGGRWLHGERLALYRVLFGFSLTLLLWAGSRWIAAGVIRRVAVGAGCGYIAGLVAYTITYKAAGYSLVMRSMHGLPALSAALQIHLVFMQLLPPAFALGAAAALLDGWLLTRFAPPHATDSRPRH